jgi:hypothetical protein
MSLFLRGATTAEVIPSLSSDSLLTSISRSFCLMLQSVASSRILPNGRLSPTKRGMGSYQTDGFLLPSGASDQHRSTPPSTGPIRRARFLPNGREAGEGPETAEKTAMVSYQTDGFSYSYLQRGRGSDTREL